MLQTIPAIEDPSAGLLRQFLLWVDTRPRTYGEVMDAWRTSCPRISVWEDALAEDLVRVEGRPDAGQYGAAVALTEAGRARMGAR